MEGKITTEELLALGVELQQKSANPNHASRTILEAQRLLRMRGRDGRESPLIANTAQIAFEQARLPHNIILKARQMGITTWVSGRFFLKTITTPGTLTVQVAQTREAAEGIFRIVQRFWECLPEQYRKGPLKRSRANVRQMVFPELDSEFRVVSAADESAGRGLTIQNLHCSEVSRWPGDAGETLAGLRAALCPGGELVLESTPNGAYGCFYDEWQRALESGMGRHFFPWWLEPAYVAAPAAGYTDEEQDLVDRHGLSPEQIGFRRTLEARYRGLRSQEFAEDAERCFRATGECAFELAAVENRLIALDEPYEVDRNGTLHRWFPPIAGRQYLVAVDTSGGGANGDYSAIQVIDLNNGAQCAELRQRLSVFELSKTAADIARSYNNAILAVERNNHGHGVLAYLESVEKPALRLYESNKQNGWLTTATSKPRMISLLATMLVKEPLLFRSKRLLSECRTFVTRANGTTGAVSGAHDDCVMAMAIAQKVREELMLGKAKRA